MYCFLSKEFVNGGHLIKQNHSITAYKFILFDITENNLPPGSPIIEEEYARELNMSRTPIREAIKRLSIEGFVLIYPGKGAFVKQLKKEDIKNCYEMVEAIEGMIAFLVAQNPSHKDIIQLEKEIEDMDTIAKSMDLFGWKDKDINFHKTLHSMCENNLLVHHAEILTLRTKQIQSNYIRGVNLEQANYEHKLILESIINKDSENARKYMQQNWQRSRREVIKLFDKKPKNLHNRDVFN